MICRTAEPMSIFGGKQRARRAQAARLRDRVAAHEFSEVDSETFIAFGRGVLEEYVRGLGGMATDCVFIVTDQAFYYEFLEETPKQILSPRSIASGVGPADWKATAQASGVRVPYEQLAETEAQRTVDGYWDLLLLPKDAVRDEDYRSFRMIELYEGSVAAADDIAELFQSLPELLDRASRASAYFEGTRPDATEDEVEQAAQLGKLHVRTNLEEVYRLVFPARMLPSESRMHFRFGQLGAMPTSSGSTMPENEDGWILVSDQAVRWHLTVEGYPGRGGAADPFHQVPHDVPFPEITKLLVEQFDASLDRAAMTTIVLVQQQHAGAFVHALSIARSGSDPVVDYLRSRVGASAADSVD